MIKSLKELLSSNFIRNIYFTKFHSVLRFGILCWGGVNLKDTSNSKTSNKINSRSKPKNPLQTTVQGTEHSYHSFTIHFGSDKLLEKTPPVCKAQLKCPHF